MKKYKRTGGQERRVCGSVLPITKPCMASVQHNLKSSTSVFSKRIFTISSFISCSIGVRIKGEKGSRGRRQKGRDNRKYGKEREGGIPCQQGTRWW